MHHQATTNLAQTSYHAITTRGLWLHIPCRIGATTVLIVWLHDPCYIGATHIATRAVTCQSSCSKKKATKHNEKVGISGSKHAVNQGCTFSGVFSCAVGFGSPLGGGLLGKGLL